MSHKYPYEWKLSQLPSPKFGKVFSCFACGGGSTMGYKLAGFDVIGCNEIDKRMNDCYVSNLHPRLNFNCDIRELKEMELPEELYNLDILDGSPPCSTFSTAGAREASWGKEKYFREGQVKQVLDTLFFDFIDLAKKLKPKVVVAENVKGLLMGNAKEYVKKIYDALEDMYYVQHFLLDAQLMGVPQRRERVFFICLRKDLAEPFLYNANLFEQKPYIDMTFNEPIIKFGEIADFRGKRFTGEKMRLLWENRRYGDIGLNDSHERLFKKAGFFGQTYAYPEKIAPTLTAHYDGIIHFNEPLLLSEREVKSISSFPMDYDFCGQHFNYICGMSVPPVMMAQIATRIQTYWLSKI